MTGWAAHCCLACTAVAWPATSASRSLRSGAAPTAEFEQGSGGNDKPQVERGQHQKVQAPFSKFNGKACERWASQQQGRKHGQCRCHQTSPRTPCHHGNEYIGAEQNNSPQKTRCIELEEKIGPIDAPRHGQAAKQCGKNQEQLAVHRWVLTFGSSGPPLAVPLEGRLRPRWTTHGILLRTCLGPPDVCGTAKTGFHNLAMEGSNDRQVSSAQKVVAVNDG